MIRNPIPWPNNAKCAVSICFDMDADSLIHISKPNDSFRRLYPSLKMGTKLVITDTYMRILSKHMEIKKNGLKKLLKFIKIFVVNIQ